MLGSYFASSTGALPAAGEAAPPSPTASGDEAVVHASEDTAPADGLDASPGHQEEEQQQQEPARATRPTGRRVAFQSPAVPEDGDAATPEPQRPGIGQGSADGAATPYDDVLSMLRHGPLAAQSPRSFPRPRSSSLLTAAAGRTPGLALAPSASPSPAAADPSSRRLGLAGSRLGPAGGAGGGATPLSGIRPSFSARSASRFSRTPVHMQPLAAGGPGGSGGTSRFGLAAAAAAAAPGEGDAARGLSPAPLAWTPMRSHLAAGGRGGPVSGAKRKAEPASPSQGGRRLLACLRSAHATSCQGLHRVHPGCPCAPACTAAGLHRALGPCTHTTLPSGAPGPELGCVLLRLLAGEDQSGNISLLDAQRRIRQRAEPAANGAGAAAGGDRRSWRAGRTPFHAKGTGLSRFGAALGQQQQPAPLTLGATVQTERDRSASASPGLAGRKGRAGQGCCVGGLSGQAALRQHPASCMHSTAWQLSHQSLKGVN